MRPVCRLRMSFGSDTPSRETADLDFLFAKMISKVCRRASSLAGVRGGERGVERRVRSCKSQPRAEARNHDAPIAHRRLPVWPSVFLNSSRIAAA